MARKRMINPSIWSNDKITVHSRDERLLYIGLFSNADDKGRLPGSARRIRGIVFPHDEDLTDEIIEGWLQSLTAKKRIRRWDENGETYIEFLPATWDKEQKMNYTAKSYLPSYRQQSQRITQDLLRPDADLTQDFTTREGKGREEKRIKRREESLANPPSAIGISDNYSDDFLAFWSAYPYRPNANKRRSWKKWKARLREDIAPGHLINAAQFYAEATVGKDPEFRMAAERFLGPDEEWKPYVDGIPEEEGIKYVPADLS